LGDAALGDAALGDMALGDMALGDTAGRRGLGIPEIVGGGA
jgi:hypothetical protein